jgi:hypothetical protein
MRSVTFFFAGRILYRGIALETTGNSIKQEEKKHAEETSTATGQRDTWSQ